MNGWSENECQFGMLGVTHCESRTRRSVQLSRLVGEVHAVYLNRFW